MTQLINSIYNDNGGGLSFEVTGKYTSCRHELARLEGKLTAGEAAKSINKILKVKATARDLVDGYRLLTGREPEWHHAGFYKGRRGKTMGRTFFFSADQIENLIENWATIAQKKAEESAEKEKQAQTYVKGFYYDWDFDYNGRYGRRRNHKVLRAYEGPEINKPKNFTPCDDKAFEVVKSKVGRKYYGWDEPTLSEFTPDQPSC